VTIEISADLRASIDGLAESVREQNRHLARAQQALDHIPMDVPIMTGGTTSAAGTVVLACRGPARGRQWQVRQLAVAGPTKGVVRLIRLPVTPTSPYNQGVVDTTSTRWPAPAFYGEHQFVLQGGETLWVVVTGATATTVVTVNGAAEDYDVAAYGARFAL
jgi:hypothetical protein